MCMLHYNIQSHSTLLQSSNPSKIHPIPYPPNCILSLLPLLKIASIEFSLCYPNEYLGVWGLPWSLLSHL